MSNLKEYIVTAKSYEVLDDLCNDIETPGGNLYIPGRAVEVANLRPISRNTHYYLTEEEAEQIRQDPRVLAVELTPDQLGISPSPSYVQSSDFWSRSAFPTTADQRNWGLLRSFEGQNRPAWGNSDPTATVTGTITINASGKGVDVVVVDGFMDPSHPEYAKNADGSGGSRVVQYNWYQHNPQVTGSSTGTYVYGPYTFNNATLDTNNNHGAHVAGIVAGNTQGWARDASIYNIYPYSTNPSTTVIFDYIREFHKSKPVDKSTGVRRPTIVNNSWGFSSKPDISTITAVKFRGTVYNGPFTTSQLANFGIVSDGTIALISRRNAAVDADIEDALADGIIITGSAGNFSQPNSEPGGIDWDNYVVYTYLGFISITANYSQGTSPSAAPGVINVGAASAFSYEAKAYFSNNGPRVDLFSPGESIISSVNTSTSYGGVPDPRNSLYSLIKLSGTSMACPQVTGVLACALEVYPNMTPAQAVDYITSYASSDQMYVSSGGITDYYDLLGAPNKYLAYVQERKLEGEVYPKNNYKARPSDGVVFPRTRILRYGR